MAQLTSSENQALLLLAQQRAEALKAAGDKLIAELDAALKTKK